MIARINETKLLVRPPVFTDCPKHLHSLCDRGAREIDSGPGTKRDP